MTEDEMVGSITDSMDMSLSKLLGEGNGNPLQCSCLENPRDGGAWWAAVYGVAQSQTRLKQLSSSPSNEYSGLISFRMDWLDLLAAQGTLYSLLQHHSSKASILWHSVFFIVQLFHPYMTTGKTIALTIWTFSVKWCLCFLIWCLGLS